MFTFRKALMIAGFVLTFFFLLHNSNPAPSVSVYTYSTSTSGDSSGDDTTGQVQTTGRPATVSMSGRPYAGTKPAAKKPYSQISLADLAGKPLREQLRYQFPYDVEEKFPAYIWQTWKYTPNEGGFQDRFRPAEASWTEHHPLFVHEVITDSTAVTLIKYLYASIPDVVEAYNALPVPVLKADFFRYLILLARGGIYSDIDTFSLKPTMDWLPDNIPRSSVGLIVGIEADPDRPDWKDWYSRRIQFCQWTIQSKPGHPVLRDIVATITEDTLRMKHEGHLKEGKIDKSIVEFTGPAVWTDSIFHYLNNPEYFDKSAGRNITWENFTGLEAHRQMGDVVVLPITSFSPGVGQMGARDSEDPMAFVRHDFEGTSIPYRRVFGEQQRNLTGTFTLGSWKPDSERFIGSN
ncbi:MAG: membrane-bound alpha-1,6- mannosyltransferase Initiation-specific [Cirrosporium novae-zelandiae]|nr:MAG: membrane-bound alpha-1,6- mannosyltransferase Initiation-specific [Cirrosporium novae-zelandiae]